MSLPKTLIILTLGSFVLAGCSKLPLPGSAMTESESTGSNDQDLIKDETIMTGNDGTTLTTEIDDATPAPKLSPKDDLSSLEKDLNNTSISEESF